MTARGHPRAIFNRAIERDNLAVAETTAREMGRITLVEALELTALIALKDRRRHGPAGARWTRRYLDENAAAGLDDLAFVVGALSALGGPRHAAALAALRGVATGADAIGASAQR
ncbi:MAG: hypothetical protein QOH95_578 [Gaiellaceae bacterium]|nr:hypothetical protein [Gaiellaceae bacterium]